MKTIRHGLIHSLVGFLLAVCASSPIFAASFTLSEDVRLENVSTLNSIDDSYLVQASYIARQPTFLSQIDDILENEAEEGPRHNVSFALATRQTSTLSLRLGEDWLIDNEQPRVFWHPIDATEVNYEIEGPEAPPVLADLTWDGHSKSASDGILFPFLIAAEDTTCGFPNDLLRSGTLASSDIGQNWIKTATFPPHPFGGPSIPPLDDVTWLNMPAPKLDRTFPKTNHDGFNAPWAFLTYKRFHQSSLSMVGGFYQKPEVFKCRTFASALDRPYTSPFPPNFFVDAGFTDFPPFVTPVDPNAVPLPSPAALLFGSLFGLGFFGRRSHSQTRA